MFARICNPGYTLNEYHTKAFLTSIHTQLYFTESIQGIPNYIHAEAMDVEATNEPERQDKETDCKAVRGTAFSTHFQSIEQTLILTSVFFATKHLMHAILACINFQYMSGVV